MNASQISQKLLEVEEPFDPEAYLSRFVDQNLGANLLIHKSGDHGVFARDPFRYDYIVYSDDPIVGPDSIATRTYKSDGRRLGGLLAPGPETAPTWHLAIGCPAGRLRRPG
jgi:hypothetical protein